mgnify:FL=1
MKFGTDGIRGIFGKEITEKEAFLCGSALSRGKKINVLIGRDTRIGGKQLTYAFACGLKQNGSTAVDVGICPTSGIAFLTKKLGFDYGVSVTASHNPPEYNGIKIFSCKGEKISPQIERKISSERREDFDETLVLKGEKPENCLLNEEIVKHYVDFLSGVGGDLSGLSVVLDVAEGAAYKIAPTAFENSGVKVKAIFSSGDGSKINVGCGALHVENLKKQVLGNGADIGFAFDGDADRVVAVDKFGEVIDGDKMLYILSLYYKNCGNLTNDCAVGTIYTNSGVQEELEKNAIKLFRSKVGDKFVYEKMKQTGAVVGGEKSGHIILNNLHCTGDGILTAKILCRCLLDDEKLFYSHKNLKLYPQINVNLDNSQIKTGIKDYEKTAIIGGCKVRIIIRKSGTEKKTRITVEGENYAKEISDAIIKEIKKG